MKKDPLQREIIRCILANIGIAPSPNWGKRGLSVSDLKTDKYIKIEYEPHGEVVDHPIWAGQVLVDGQIIRAVAVDLSSSESYELAAVVQLKDMPMYAMRLCYDDVDDGIFVLSADQAWVSAGNIIKARALIGSETIKSFGVIWEPCDEIDDLIKALRSLSDM